MNREECLKIVDDARKTGEIPNLFGANLSRADLSRADLDFSSLPLWCGGILMKLDRHLSLQFIYHVFNQEHLDEDIIRRLEPLRDLANEFRDRHRTDAPVLRGEVEP